MEAPVRRCALHASYQAPFLQACASLATWPTALCNTDAYVLLSTAWMLQQPCAVENRLPQCQDGARSSTERLTPGGPLISKQQQTCAGLCTKTALQVGTLGHVAEDIVGLLPAIMLAFCSVNVLRLYGDGGHSVQYGLPTLLP